MIARIARKEFEEMTRDGRFRCSAAAVLLLLVGTMALGWKQQRDVAAERRSAALEARQAWLDQGEKNPHGAAHFGTYAFKPRPPLSLLDPGLEVYTGVAVYLEAHKQNEFGYPPARDATAVARFGSLTAASVLQLLLPLLIIVVAAPAFSGEREQGTLRQLLSLGVRPRDLALGKALGVAGALATLLVPATLIGVAAIAMSTGSTDPAGDALGLAGMTVGCLLYLGAFVGLTLAVSAWAPSTRLALVGLIGFWIANGLVIPRVAADLSKALHPTPSAARFWADVAADNRSGVDGHNSQDERAVKLKDRLLKEHNVSKIDDLPVNFDAALLMAGEEHADEVHDKHFPALWDAFGRQERAQLWGGLVAPLLALRPLSMGLAGTDFAQHRRFAEAAEAYRRGMNRTLNGDLVSRRGEKGNAIWEYRAGRELWEKIPDFSYQSPGAGRALRGEAVPMILLVGWFALPTTAAFVAASRMKVG